MFIEVELTPNPDALKFLAGQAVVASPIDFADKESAKQSSIFAAGLFDIDGVARVHLGRDFIAVTKEEQADWSDLKPSIMAALMDQALSGLPFVEQHAAASVASDDPIVQKILHVLDERVRPAVAQDGGDVEFDRFEEGVVYLRMRGACSGCPSSSKTLKHGIENLLKHFVPEVMDVQQTL